MSNPRVLEIGEFRYFRHEYPETTLLWTGHKLPRSIGWQEFWTPRRFARAVQDARAGRYDLVVAYLPLRSPWHPRNWLRPWARRPWRLVSGLTRGFGVWALKFVDLPVPLVAIDFNDAFTIGRHNFFLLDKARLVFKRELPADRWNVVYGSAHPFLPTRRTRASQRWQARLARMRPIGLPHLFPDEIVGGGNFPEKDADIFFAGTVKLNSWLRRTGGEELKRLAERGIKLDIAEERLSREEFYRRMTRAWLAWSPAGFGWESYRHAEAAQCLTVPLINHPTIERYQPLIAGEHAFYYDIEPGGLTRAVEAALSDKERLKRMAVAARAHVRTHFSRRAIVDYVLRSVGLAAK